MWISRDGTRAIIIHPLPTSPRNIGATSDKAVGVVYVVWIDFVIFTLFPFSEYNEQAIIYPDPAFTGFAYQFMYKE
jgi:hypothetical protein